MARDWQNIFETWGSPPSATEEQERDRTEAEIRAALEPLQRLRRFKVYPKGSYRRGTNVRRGSDVDVAVELRGSPSEESFRVAKLFNAKDLTDGQLGLVDVKAPMEVLGMTQFKKDVHDALVTAYGSGAVKWSDKCLQVRERATTLPADVVPCRYYRRYDSATAVREGIELKPDSGGSIINWPQQDDDNGVLKNKRTNLRFKRAVRGLKSLENEMADNSFIKPVSSFLIECAVYNVPDSAFASSSNYQNCLSCLQEFARVLQNASLYQDWVEVNDLKYLFRSTQPWSSEDLARLVDGAVSYLKEAA